MPAGRKCPSHDPNCGCHGPIMSKGMVGWAGGSAGPDLFIYTAHMDLGLERSLRNNNIVNRVIVPPITMAQFHLNPLGNISPQITPSWDKVRTDDVENV